VPNLIDRVRALTEVLVPHAPEAERECLFLCGEVMATRRVTLIPDYLASVHVRRFVKRHDLRGADGKPLKLTIAALRATGLTLAHVTLGYDLLKTQALANHASPDTTRHYVERPAVRAAQEVELARLQGRFVSWVRGDPEVVARELRVGRREAVDIASEVTPPPADSPVPTRSPASHPDRGPAACALHGSAASPARTR
jgi:hypothetical protein